MQVIEAGGRVYNLAVKSIADTPREQLDADAGSLYALFAQREQEFGFGAGIVVDYPAIDASGSFLNNPADYIDCRLREHEVQAPVSKVVILTTFGQKLLEPLKKIGFEADLIDMPAGPEDTYSFSLNRHPPEGRVLYLEAVNEADEKTRPTFVLQLRDEKGELCGRALGSVHSRGAKRYAYLSILTLVRGMPATTGGKLAKAQLALLKRDGVTAIHLGTQTAGRFYQKQGFEVTHRLVSGLRTRTGIDGMPISEDLVMLAMKLN